MRRMMIIAVAAVTAAFSFGVPAFAGTVTVRTTHHSTYHQPHHHNCWVKTVRHRDRHGHIVMRKTRVCR